MWSIAVVNQKGVEDFLRIAAPESALEAAELECRSQKWWEQQRRSLAGKSECVSRCHGDSLGTTDSQVSARYLPSSHHELVPNAPFHDPKVSYAVCFAKFGIFIFR